MASEGGTAGRGGTSAACTAAGRRTIRTLFLKRPVLEQKVPCDVPEGGGAEGAEAPKSKGTHVPGGPSPRS